MKRKLNWKLLLLLGVLTALGLGAFLTVTVRGSARSLMSRGDVFAANHEYQEALTLYRRGLQSEPHHMLLLSKCATMVQALGPEPLDVALEHTRFMMQCYERILSVDPVNDFAQNAILTLAYDWASSLNDQQLWQNLYDRAKDLIASARIMQAPANPVARRYLAVAEMNRGVTVDVEEAELRIRDVLMSSLQEFPEDDELTVLLANYYTAMGRRMKQLDQPVSSARFFDEAEQVLVGGSGSTVVQVARARTFFTAGRLANALEVLRQLERGMDRLTDRRALQAAAELYREFDLSIAAAQPALKYNVVSILERLRDQYPDMMIAQMMLATWYKEQQDFDGMESTLLTMWEGHSEVIPGSRALAAASLRPAAGGELVQLYLQRSEQPNDSGYIEKSRVILDRLQLVERKDSLLYVLEGKVSLAEGKFERAAEQFIEAESRYGIEDPQVLYQMSRALLALGETDAAHDRLLQILQRGTVSPRVCLDLVQICLQERDFIGAQKYADVGARAFPENEELKLSKVQVLLARAEARPDGDRAEWLAKARNILLEVPTSNEDAVWAKARVLRSEGQLEQAYDLLMGAIEANPLDQRATLLLIDVEVELGRQDSAIERLLQLRETDPASAVIAFRLADLMQDQSVLAPFETAVLEDADRLDDRYRLYEYHRRHGRVEKALVFLDQAAQLRPNSYKLLSELLKRRIELQAWGAAEKLVVRARELNVDQVQGYAFDGQLQLARGQFDRAEFLFQQAVNMRPNDSELWKMLGDAMVQAGKPQSAQDAYERAVKLRPRLDAQWALHRLYHLQGNYQQAGKILSQLAAVSGDAGARNMELNYMALYVDANRARAERQALLKSEPDNWVNWRALAGIYEQAGEYADARRLLDKLNARTPRSLTDVVGLATVMREQDEAEAGLAVLTEYVLSKGDNAEVLDWLALARFEDSLKRQELAESHFRKALDVDQTLLAARAYADWLKSHGQMKTAIDQFRWIKEQSDQAQDELRYIIELLEMGNRSLASAELVDFLNDHPADAQTLILKGLIAESEQREGDAGDAFDQAIEMAPSNPNAFYQRASFALRYPESHTEEEAIADLKQALKFDPEMREAREMLARLEADRSGGETRAAMHYLAIIDATPERKEPYLALARLYLRSKELWKLEPLLGQARKQFPADPVWDQVTAQMLLQVGRKQDALVMLQKLFEAHPSIESLQSMVQLQLQLEQYDELLRTLQEQAALAKDSGWMTGIRGVALAQTGRLDAGWRTVGEGLRQLSEQSVDLEPLLSIAERCFRPARWVELCEEFLKSGYDVAVCARLAERYISERQFELAEALLREGLIHPQGRVRLLSQQSSLRVAQGRPADAALVCEEILKVAPNDILALNNLAHLLSEELGAPERALIYAEKAVELSGRQSGVPAGLLDTLGMVHYRLNNFEQAVFYFNRSLNEQETETVRAHLKMASNRLTTGD